MNAEFTAKLMAQNVDLEALVKIQAYRIAELEKEADRLSNHANELRKIHANRIAELESKL
jgi:hypothetical protein